MRPHKADVIPGYMQQTLAFFRDLPGGMRILDLPAGRGKLTSALRRLGHEVVPADIDCQQEDYVYADMTKRLPFDDESFDGVICLEGIEHVLNPYLLMGELFRVSKIGGYIAVSTPNIMNMWSRLQFLLTGTFHQFHPAQLHEYEPHDVVDRFHISPMSYHTLRYLGAFFGARVAEVRGDKVKRAFLLPVFLAIQGLGKLWSHRLYFSKKYQQYADRNEEIYRHTNSWPLITGRSVIMIFQKTQATQVLPTDVFLHQEAAQAA
jgi:SAM-dependent methyltransferase